MEFKTTKKAVMNGYWKVISVGYCDLQYLLYHKSRTAYTSGVDGWNADVYDFGRIAIVTGYRPFGNVNVDYDRIREYEVQADYILHSKDVNMTYEERKCAVNKLLEEFIEEVTA